MSREQFKCYQANAKFIVQGSEGDDCPANEVWSRRGDELLSLAERARRDFADDEMCYLPEDEIDVAKHIHLSDELLNGTSYRLPTEAEWEIRMPSGDADAMVTRQ